MEEDDDDSPPSEEAFDDEYEDEQQGTTSQVALPTVSVSEAQVLPLPAISFGKQLTEPISMHDAPPMVTLESEALKITSECVLNSAVQTAAPTRRVALFAGYTEDSSTESQARKSPPAASTKTGKRMTVTPAAVLAALSLPGGMGLPGHQRPIFNPAEGHTSKERDVDRDSAHRPTDRKRHTNEFSFSSMAARRGTVLPGKAHESPKGFASGNMVLLKAMSLANQEHGGGSASSSEISSSEEDSDDDSDGEEDLLAASIKHGTRQAVSHISRTEAARCTLDGSTKTQHGVAALISAQEANAAAGTERKDKKGDSSVGDTSVDAAHLALRNARNIQQIIQEAGDEQAKCHEKWLRRRAAGHNSSRQDSQRASVGGSANDRGETEAKKAVHKLRRKRRNGIATRLENISDVALDEGRTFGSLLGAGNSFHGHGRPSQRLSVSKVGGARARKRSTDQALWLKDEKRKTLEESFSFSLPEDRKKSLLASIDVPSQAGGTKRNKLVGEDELSLEIALPQNLDKRLSHNMFAATEHRALMPSPAGSRRVSFDCGGSRRGSFSLQLGREAGAPRRHSDVAQAAEFAAGDPSCDSTEDVADHQVKKQLPKACFKKKVRDTVKCRKGDLDSPISQGTAIDAGNMTAFRRRRLPEVPRLRNKFRDRRWILSDNWRREAETNKRYHLEVAQSLGLEDDDWSSLGLGDSIYTVSIADLAHAAERKDQNAREAAASMLQRRWKKMRLWRTHKRFLAQRKRAVDKIERWWHMKSAYQLPIKRRVDRRPVEWSSAVRLQSMIRGWVTRKRLRIHRELHKIAWQMHCLNIELGANELYAVRRLQALVRGVITRKRVQAKIESRRKAEAAARADEEMRRKLAEQSFSYLAKPKADPRARGSRSSNGSFVLGMRNTLMSPRLSLSGTEDVSTAPSPTRFPQQSRTPRQSISKGNNESQLQSSTPSGQAEEPSKMVQCPQPTTDSGSPEKPSAADLKAKGSRRPNSNSTPCRVLTTPLASVLKQPLDCRVARMGGLWKGYTGTLSASMAASATDENDNDQDMQPALRDMHREKIGSFILPLTSTFASLESATRQDSVSRQGSKSHVIAESISLKKRPKQAFRLPAASVQSPKKTRHLKQPIHLNTIVPNGKSR